MIRLPARLPACAAAALALPGLTAGTPLAAQQQQQQPSGSFRLPAPSPAPTPAAAGPADERAGVRIPPRAVPRAAPSIAPQPVLTASPAASPAARPAAAPAARPRPGTAPPPLPAPLPAAGGGALPDAAPAPAAIPAGPTATLPEGAPGDPARLPPASAARRPATPSPQVAPAPPLVLPDWWPWAAGGLGTLVLLGGAGLWLGRRQQVQRLPAPMLLAAAEAGDPALAEELPRMDLALAITGATRSVMMFTLTYRLTIANRSDRAVNGLSLAVQLACARASGGGRGEAGATNAPSPGAAQRSDRIARIGPHQSRSISGEVQLPLSMIAPLRQGGAPLFIPLVHVTLEGDAQRALARSFVIGTPSAAAAGRVHPIPLDQPPGAINGLVAQAIAILPAAAAAA